MLKCLVKCNLFDVFNPESKIRILTSDNIKVVDSAMLETSDLKLKCIFISF